MKNGQPNRQQVTDEQLVARFRLGDEAALGLLMLRSRGMIAARASRFFAPGPDREDLVQEGWLAFLKAVRSYRPQKNVPFAAFAALCVKNRMISLYRQSRRESGGQLCLDDASLELTDTALQVENPEHAVLSGEYVDTALRHLKMALSSREYQVLVLFVQGLSYEDMAKLLDTTPKGISNTLQRIRRKMRQSAPLG